LPQPMPALPNSGPVALQLDPHAGSMLRESRGGFVPRTRHSARLVMATTIVAAALSLSAGVANAATSTAGDACPLLTKEDAAAALGEAVNGPKSRSGLPMGPGTMASYCEYTGSGFHKVHLNLIQMSTDTAAMYKAMCAQKSKEGLAGLGDISCWYNEKHTELQAIKGVRFISIEMTASGNPTEAIKAAMKKALDRLR
jgi:hypothetical protein